MKPLSYRHKPPTEPRKMAKQLSGKAGNQYNTIGMHRDGKYFTKRIAPIVLSVFGCPRPIGMECCHGVNGQFDDSISNLRWGTHKENMKDKYRDGTQPVGERAGNSKLNELQVRIIRRAYELFPDIFSLRYLARTFRIDHRTVRCIVYRKNWKHI